MHVSGQIKIHNKPLTELLIYLTTLSAYRIDKAYGGIFRSYSQTTSYYLILRTRKSLGRTSSTREIRLIHSRTQ